MPYAPAVLSICFVLMGLGEWCSSSVLAGEQLEVKPSSKYTGLVTDPAGAPAADCRVWLIRDTEPVEVVEEVQTDACGRFRFSTPPQEASFAVNQPPSLAVLALDSLGRLAEDSWVKPHPSVSGSDNDPTFELREVPVCQGRLMDSSGQPIVGAKIEPWLWLSRLPPSVARELGTVTALDGTFVLKVLPIRIDTTTRVSASIVAGEFGRVDAHWDYGSPITIQLEKTGSVGGSLVCRTNPSAAAGITLELVHLESTSSDDRGYSIYYHGRAVTQRDGTFCFDGVVPGKYQIGIVTDDQFPYYLDAMDPFEVNPGRAISAIAVPMERCCWSCGGPSSMPKRGQGYGTLRFRFTSKTTMASIAGERPRSWMNWGRLSRSHRPGKIEISLVDVPDEYRWSASRRGLSEIEVSTDTTLPPVRLQRTPVIEGHVVDEDGCPVPNADVLTFAEDAMTPDPWQMPDDQHFKTDAQGKFRLTGVLIKERFSLRVSTATAATNGPLVVDLENPIRVVISPKYAFAIRGIVHDDQGKPIVGSDVWLRPVRQPLRARSTSTWRTLLRIVRESSSSLVFGRVIATALGSARMAMKASRHSTSPASQAARTTLVV